MMKQEFEERANFKVSPECYHTFIEPGYNASTLEEDCVSKDKKATYNYVKKNEGYVVLNEKQRAEQAASMTGHELDQKIETAKQLLNQLEELGKEFDLKENIKEVHKCIYIYTKERDQRKEAGTWKEWGV